MDESTHTAEYGEIIRLLTEALWAYAQSNPNVVIYTEMYLDGEDQIARYLKDNVRLILVINPRPKTRVYPSDATVQLSEIDALDGGDVLPGFSLPVRDLFAD